MKTNRISRMKQNLRLQNTAGFQLPATETVHTISALALSQGRLEDVGRNVDSPTFIPPEIEDRGNLAFAFLGMFVNDPGVARRLKQAVEQYPFRDKVIRSEDDLAEHMLRWERWELGIESLHEGYTEAIKHLCAGERLGKTWPMRIHGTVCTYLIDRGYEQPIFEPYISPRTLVLQRGSIDGFYVNYAVQINTEHGWKPVVELGVSKREAMNRRSPEERRSLEPEYEHLRQDLGLHVGHQRRRGMELRTVEERARWLFDVHVRRRSAKQVAVASQSSEATVKRRVQELRLSLDLQPKDSVKCKHKQRPSRIYVRSRGA